MRACVSSSSRRNASSEVTFHTVVLHVCQEMLAIDLWPAVFVCATRCPVLTPSMLLQGAHVVPLSRRNAGKDDWIFSKKVSAPVPYPVLTERMVVSAVCLRAPHVFPDIKKAVCGI